MNALKQSNLKIAIQGSGRMTEESEKILHDIGLDYENYKRQMFATCRTFPAEVLFVRDDDIPEYVAKGSADLGIVGGNIVDEMGSDVETLALLNFAHCNVDVAVPLASDIKDFKGLQGKRIATTYANTTKKFLDRAGISAEIIPIKGSVEITPLLGVADAIVDIVASGGTLRANGLMSIGTVLASQATLIANRDALAQPKKKSQIDRILLRITSILAARPSKYIMMNAPASAVDAIKSVLPGMKSTTVIPLQKPDWVAIHTVTNEEKFWEVMEKLHETGATDILVVDIEKMIK